MTLRAPSCFVQCEYRVSDDWVNGVVVCCAGVWCRLKLVVGLEAGGGTRVGMSWWGSSVVAVAVQ